MLMKRGWYNFILTGVAISYLCSCGNTSEFANTSELEYFGLLDSIFNRMEKLSVTEPSENIHFHINNVKATADIHQDSTFTLITISWLKGNEAMKEYYLEKDHRLLFAKEKIKQEAISENDDNSWTGKYYFDDGVMMNFYTRGTGKSEKEDWDPESIVNTYHNRKKAIEEVYKIPY
ncbi:hypothetical protein LVD15_17380 [Fulvivirga maritima]|uniref:hypothetical protein n=1 Tax=Fulvivirga maritima TaxID=2904247 RepID=UPI001F355D7B|nr:hypothetical protein [Fulvivirga maritima]UII25073.1 hypothetical protein LVD15_17380 [Fulvivirga maritima]